MMHYIAVDSILVSMRNLRLRAYIDQKEDWPASGRAMLAQFDDQTVVVYQAFNRAIARYAVENQRFGAGFDLDRMSWIKPGFLWMMARSAWASAAGQERVLACWLRRDAFETILARAVASSFQPDQYPSPQAWQSALKQSEVRLQWDPDYDAKGIKQKRRAIQLGLSGATLRAYAQEWIAEIQDISDYVREQARFRDEPEMLLTPVEKPYPIADPTLARRLMLDRTVPGPTGSK